MTAEARSDHDGDGRRWDGGWDATRRRQRDAWSASTPTERLAWLERAIRFAHEAGALPRREDAASDE